MRLNKILRSIVARASARGAVAIRNGGPTHHPSSRKSAAGPVGETLVHTTAFVPLKQFTGLIFVADKW